MKDRKFIIVDTEIGMIAGNIVDYNDQEDAYVLSLNGELILARKEFVYEYEGDLYIQGHDVG